jgi:hypothetical protein
MPLTIVWIDSQFIAGANPFLIVIIMLFLLLAAIFVYRLLIFTGTHFFLGFKKYLP